MLDDRESLEVIDTTDYPISIIEPIRGRWTEIFGAALFVLSC